MTKMEKEIIAKAVNEKWEELAKEEYKDRLCRGVAGGGYLEQEMYLSDTEPQMIKNIRNEWCTLSELAKVLKVEVEFSVTAAKLHSAIHTFLSYGEVVEL